MTLNRIQILRCIWCVKDTNLKANHNVTGHMSREQKMYLMCQRYKFKSKSQHTLLDIIMLTGCIWCVKDTNLKANHNPQRQDQLFPTGVFDVSKIQI